MNVLGSGDGNNDSHDLQDATEADIQADINAVVDGFFDSAKFRYELKYPDLEVVVDGEPMSAPFAAAVAANRRFKLPGGSKYVQIFATHGGRREIISNLILSDTEVSSGKTWQSKLTLEGKQTVTLSVEPEMDDTGNLANSYLLLTYGPRLSLLKRLTDGLKGLRTRSAVLWERTPETSESQCHLRNMSAGKAAAKISIEEIAREPHEMGVDPNRPIPARIRLLLTQPKHVFVRNDVIKDECSDEVKLLILKIRELGAQQRYDEALDLALKATRIDPNCWRAKTSLGVLLVALEQVDDGDKVFTKVLRDFPNTNKALSTALHASAWVAETRCKLRPEAKTLQEISRRYEQALKLDPSAANTRASLFICHANSGETEKRDQLIKESVMHEGFYAALRFELNVRGAAARKALLGLSTELRKLLYPIDLVTVESHAYQW